jgi:hypothetical protein
MQGTWRGFPQRVPSRIKRDVARRNFLKNAQTYKQP